MGGMLEWDTPDGDPFRAVLAHPRLTPVLNQLVGVGHRMDHLPLLISQTQGAEGFKFHGGATEPDGSWAFDLAYQVSALGLASSSLFLVDVSPERRGRTGFCLTPKTPEKGQFPYDGPAAQLSSPT